MDREQVLQAKLDDYYRCGDQAWLHTDGEKSHSSIHKMDATIEEKINHTLWRNDVLRVTDNNEIDIHVKNGIVYMSGYMISKTKVQRVEKALQSIEGIRGFRSNLVVDDELISEIATSLGQLEQIHHCKFFTGVSYGVVVLNGEVSSRDVRMRAEQCAASNPKVRGVINYIRAPGVDLGMQDHRLLQPSIGKEIYFCDGVSGKVRQVVINPGNRRVVAMTIEGHIDDLKQNLALSNNSTAQSAEELLVIPMSIMGHLTNDSGFLTVESTDFTKYQKYDASRFSAPNKDWVPPYPYCPADVLFPVEHKLVDKKIKNVPNQASSTLITEEQELSKQLLANDSLGG